MPLCAWTASDERRGRVSRAATRTGEPPRPLAVYAALLGTAALVVALDQAVKEVVLRTLDSGPLDVVEGAVTLRLTFNSGGAFGIGQGFPGVFLVATVAISALILGWARKLDDLRLVVPLGLILGGGLGNLWDRLFRGFGGRVVDYVDLHIWPVFNLADSAIVLGVTLILVATLRRRQVSE
jgi:signal peptidase II